MDSDYGVPRELSEAEKRTLYQPELPPCLQGTTVSVEYGDVAISADPVGVHVISHAFPHTYGQQLAHFVRKAANVADTEVIPEQTPVRVGVVSCGKQSPGGHNVIWGLHEAIKAHNPDSKLMGFIGGYSGLLELNSLEITDEHISSCKNQGGIDMFGMTKDQIKIMEHVNGAMASCHALKLDALVIIGGVTSSSDAAQLAETFAESKCATKVVGVPVTLNGDLKNIFVETTVGFDTSCKVNSQLISNMMCRNALSAEKYYYFIRMMGQKASHVALECALQLHANMVILGEEVAAFQLTISDITKQICDAIQMRGEKGKNHGFILITEGLVDSISELHALLQEINGLHGKGVSIENISSQLPAWAAALFDFLPQFIREQLLLRPESNDLAQLSQIETEKLLAQLVGIEMSKRSKEGTYKGKKLNAICHSLGYQARDAMPSKFDCDYAYVLGHVSYHILAAGLNGYMATVTNLKSPLKKWRCGAVPFSSMMTVKRCSGPATTLIGKPAVHMAGVDLRGKAYELLRQNSSSFLLEDIYRNPGPLQFEGPGADSKAISLCVEDQDYMGRNKKMQKYLEKVKKAGLGSATADLTSVAADLGGKLLGSADHDWRRKCNEFVELFYKTLNIEPEELHQFYNQKCDASWDILLTSHRLRSSEEIQRNISVLAHDATFSLKSHVIRKIKKAILIVANGICKTGNKSRNFVHSVVLHRQTSLILTEVFLVIPAVLPFHMKSKTSPSDVMVVYNEACLEHIPPDPRHPERPDRIKDILKQLETDGVLKRVLVQESEPAQRTHVLAAHSEDYLSSVDQLPFSAEEMKSSHYMDSRDMYSSTGTKQAVYLAAGAATKACDAVFKEGFRKAFALVRPPGHHASRERAEGFCILNNAAIAAKYLQAEYGIENVLLVDIDAHHGNGSQSIFYEDNSVMVFSMHSKLDYPDPTNNESMSKLYTSIGKGRGKGFNVNMPMDDGYGDSDVLYALDKVLLPLVSAFKPGAVVVSAGFDAARGDGILNCDVTHKCYGTVVERLLRHGNGKLILTLEGGYGPDALPICVSTCLRSLLGDEEARLSEDDIRALAEPFKTTVATAAKLIRLLKEEWGKIPFRC